MARLSTATESFVRSIQLPEKTETYTPISHGSVIDLTRESLKNIGLGVVNEEYRTSRDGRVLQSIYTLDFSSDSEMRMMFAWANSYDKSMRFKCAIGTQVFVCSNGMLRGDTASYSRKHSTYADEDIYGEIANQLSIAETRYKQFSIDRDEMKEVVVPEKRMLEVYASMFFKHDLLTTEQLNTIKSEYLDPSFDYNCDRNSLWANYQHITHALKTTHPRDYMKNQKEVHKYICDEFDLSRLLITPSGIEVAQEEPTLLA